MTMLRYPFLPIITKLGETLGIKLVPDILTFTSSGIDNWTVPQTVQVVSFDDNFDEEITPR